MGQVKEITSAEFEQEVLQSELPVVVDFYATWCPPCKMLAPLLDTMADKYKDKVKIVKVDTDKNPDLAQKYQIRGVPTLIFFQNGQAIDQQVGLPPVEVLNEKIRKHAGIIVDQ